MKTGISTASLFLKKFNEDAVNEIHKLNAQTSEVFLATYSEYTKEFAAKINANKKDLPIHSVHALTSQFEPQLYTDHARAKEDAFNILRNFLQVGQIIGAKYYTFHGVSLLKKSDGVKDFKACAKKTLDICNECKKFNITLSYENVHWAYYSYPGFYKQLKQSGCTDFVGTLDIKQAMQSGYSYVKYLNEMAGDIVTVHLSDYDDSGKTCLPGRGIFDFKELFVRLKDVGFNGAALIEVYNGDFKEISELKQALNYINEIKYCVY